MKLSTKEDRNINNARKHTVARHMGCIALLCNCCDLCRITIRKLRTHKQVRISMGYQYPGDSSALCEKEKQNNCNDRNHTVARHMGCSASLCNCCATVVTYAR